MSKCNCECGKNFYKKYKVSVLLESIENNLRLVVEKETKIIETEVKLKENFWSYRTSARDLMDACKKLQRITELYAKDLDLPDSIEVKDE